MSNLIRARRKKIQINSVSKKPIGVQLSAEDNENIKDINDLDALGDLVVRELIMLFVRRFNTASSSCTVRSKRVADRGNHIYCATCELLVVVSLRKLCILLSSNHVVSGNVT